METKPSHVTVNAMVAAYIQVVDVNNNIVDVNLDGMSMNITMIKSDGIRFVDMRVLQSGMCQVTHVFDLQRGESLVCTVVATPGYGYTPVAPGMATLTWDTVNASTNYGDMYSWYPHITIQMKQDSIG